MVTTGGYKSPVDESLTGKRGGTLEVLQEADFEHLDPGISYFALDYTVVFATQRPLYSNVPNSNEPSPDMAASKPEVSADNKTITVHLKEGVHFSPPVNREVVAQDVAYAIERGANENVANPYIQTYFSSIEGMPQAKGGPIKGIETPNKHEIVFHLTEPKGFFVAEALCLPLTAAVPKEYAEKYDKSKPSAYANYQVATGPYMLKNNAEGKVLGIGYVPGKSATLVRNPNWNAKTDFRPAYLNEIKIHLGGTQSVIDRQVLEGKSVVQNEPVAQSAVKLAAEHYKSQLSLSPGAGNRYITLNNKVPPFNNINLRKAVYAAVDRAALDRERGGDACHERRDSLHLPDDPRLRTGGRPARVRKFDYNEHPEGSTTVAEKYMKLAGYPSGKYTGTKTVQVVGASNTAGKGRRRNRQPDAEEPRLQHEADARRNRDDVREVLRRAERRDRSLPDGRLDRRLRRPANGAEADVRRQLDRAHRQRQPGAGEHPQDQRSDGRRGTDQRQGRTLEGVGQDR